MEEAAAPPAPPAPYTFDKALYHVLITEDPHFDKRDVHQLDGTISPTGGSVALKNLNGTFADTTLTLEL